MAELLDEDARDAGVDPRAPRLAAAPHQLSRGSVKVILFAKFARADRATERFRKELARLAVADPYGDYYQYEGCQYQTATQLLDINTKRLVPICFLSEAYLAICEEEFQKTLDPGADGTLFGGSGHRVGAR